MSGIDLLGEREAFGMALKCLLEQTLEYSLQRQVHAVAVTEVVVTDADVVGGPLMKRFEVLNDERPTSKC